MSLINDFNETEQKHEMSSNISIKCRLINLIQFVCVIFLYNSFFGFQFDPNANNNFHFLINSFFVFVFVSINSFC